jgi:hypothetical protein
MWRYGDRWNKGPFERLKIMALFIDALRFFRGPGQPGIPADGMCPPPLLKLLVRQTLARVTEGGRTVYHPSGSHAGERFGPDVFSAMASAQRRDRLRQLGRTLNQMKERIQKLFENQRELFGKWHVWRAEARRHDKTSQTRGSGLQPGRSEPGFHASRGAPRAHDRLFRK